MNRLMRSPAFCAAVLMAVVGVVWGTPARSAAPRPKLPAQTPASPPATPAPPRVITLEQRGDICMARKSYDDAADYYYRALKESSFKNPALWNKMGIAFQQENKFHDARKAYSRATRIDRNFAEAWNNIGSIYYMQKRYSKSRRYYLRAIKLRSDVAAFHINLGSAYYHLKKFQKAVEEYRTALEIDPQAISADSSVGTVIHAGGADAEYYFYMAKALASVGNADLAVRYLRRALEDGFTDRQRIERDPDFKKISQHPAFVELMRNPPIAIKN
jgi:tetratricopeptide (TPR) repeat protein